MKIQEIVRLFAIALIISKVASVQNFYLKKMLLTDQITYESFLSDCFESLGNAARMLNNKEKKFEKLKDDSIENSVYNEIALLLQADNLFDKNIAEAIASDLWQLYNPVSYHNICHAIAVGLFAKTMQMSQRTNKAQDNEPADFTPNDAEKKKEATLLIAGLFHDIGHPGFGNGALLKLNDYSQLKFQAFNDKLEYILDEKAPYFVELDKKLQGLPLLDKKKSLLRNAIEQSQIKLNSIAENNEIFVNTQHAAVLKQKGMPDSEEFLHAAIAYNYLAKKLTEQTDLAKVDLDEIFLAILLTNMKYQAFWDQNRIALKQNYKHLELVHVGDLLGNVALNVPNEEKDFRLIMLGELFYEFILEFLIGDQNNDFVGVMLNEANNALIAPYFYFKQLGFYTGFITDAVRHMPASNNIPGNFNVVVDNNSVNFDFSTRLNQIINGYQTLVDQNSSTLLGIEGYNNIRTEALKLPEVQIGQTALEFQYVAKMLNPALAELNSKEGLNLKKLQLLVI